MTCSRFAGAYRYFYLVLITMLGSLVPPFTANAAVSPEWRACNGSEPQYSLDQQIAGCTSIINSGAESGDRLATAFNDRCYTIAQSGKSLEDALSDCNESLRIRPNDAHTLESRGLVHFRLGRFAKAIADDTAALGGDPKYAKAYYVRGLAKRRTGDVAGGDADIAAAKALDPKVADSYTPYGVTP